MAHTFDIRFARTEGMAALFEAPANRFRWKGAGKLSIDAEGISIAVKRGLLTLLAPRSTRIAAHSLTEVYREGDAVRLEFSAKDVREVLPIWAKGSQTAAEIVKLLPTTRTVELEHTAAQAPVYRFDRRLIVGLTSVIAALALVVWVLQRELAQPVTVALAPAIVPGVERSQPAAAASGSAALVDAKEDEFQARAPPLARNTRAHQSARLHLQIFEAELADRHEEYLEWLKSPSPTELEDLDLGWQKMVERIQGNMDYQGPELWLLRDVQLGICHDSRRFLTLFAAGIRQHESWRVGLAFDERRDAQTSIDWLRWYVP